MLCDWLIDSPLRCDWLTDSTQRCDWLTDSNLRCDWLTDAVCAGHGHGARWAGGQRPGAGGDPHRAGGEREEEDHRVAGRLERHQRHPGPCVLPTTPTILDPAYFPG